MKSPFIFFLLNIMKSLLNLVICKEFNSYNCKITHLVVKFLAIYPTAPTSLFCVLVLMICPKKSPRTLVPWQSSNTSLFRKIIWLDVSHLICDALRNTRHWNLVKVLTACSGVDYQGHDFKALVYECMSNGNLDEWLHPIARTNEAPLEKRNLNLLQRINISLILQMHWNIFIIIVIQQLFIATSSLALFFSIMKWSDMWGTLAW